VTEPVQNPQFQIQKFDYFHLFKFNYLKTQKIQLEFSDFGFEKKGTFEPSSFAKVYVSENVIFWHIHIPKIRI